MAALRVVVAEGDFLTQEGITRILSSAGMKVVGRVDETGDLVRRAVAARPDIAIVGLTEATAMAEALAATTELRREMPSTGVLLLAPFCELAFARQLIGDRPEGVGYLLKQGIGDVATFVAAVVRVAAGGTSLDPQVIRRMMGLDAADDPLAGLTRRESAVLAAIAEGKSNLGIGQSLLISQAAVEKFVTSIFRKLDITTSSSEHRRVLAVLLFQRGSHS